MLNCCGLSIFFIWSIKNWDLNNCENIVITISVVTFSQNTSIIMKILWNSLCQYNNIYISAYINFFLKKKTQNDY